MKKGCFFIFVLIITVIVAVSIYLFKNDGEIFKKVSKEKILDFAYSKFEDKFDSTFIKSSYKDSIKILLNDKINRLKNEEFNLAMKNFGEISDLINKLTKDGKIDSLDFIEIKKLVINDERSKKN
ncbi:MAG: hypothetical protein N2321_08925 [Melioribacteraceae bacterium]|nr:hypothetical protein [Melioribacteraceae bacterium]